jgi:hypothetical protein
MATQIVRRRSAVGSHAESVNPTALNWQCPNCHSTDTVKLPLVYSAGISEIRWRSRIRGLAFGASGFMLGFGRQRSSGAIQTQLSRIASPPQKKRYRYYVVAWILGFYFALWVAVFLKSAAPSNTAHLHQQFALFSWGYCGFLVCMLGILWHYNLRLYPERYREWQRSLMCRRCGKIWCPFGVTDLDSKD